ncbi:succinate CoA transferase [Poriferisphaera sp. WC338]|uniref:succinate CoA transferase n=1 Tax=Poriferisphaera sp. WC338 TaxID=3425129 RepID=UPI003D816B50
MVSDTYGSTFSRMTPEEAAELVPHGSMIAFSGFTPAGAAKAVPAALAERAKQLHDKGEEYQVSVLTGASTGKDLDEALASADAIAWRAPYQSSKALRGSINKQKTEFLDMHLSHVPQMLAFGFIRQPDFAIVEATDVTPDGRVYLTTSSGISAAALRYAKKVIIEINRAHTPRLSEMHDVAILPKPPHRNPIPIFHPLSKMGTPFANVDPTKIVAVVEHEQSDGVAPFAEPDAVSNKIAEHVVNFLVNELKIGRIPPEFLPLQSGVGNVANAVMAGLGNSEDVPPFYMYSEVFQDALVDLMENGKLLGASTTSLTLSDPQIKRMYDNMDFFAPRVVLRPQELSNNPGVVRRLGVIAINTAIEADIYGHVNSTHICGTQLMNGIGGSGDFIRNAYLSIFVAPSIAKGGKISAVVPMASHIDHSEHSVSVFVTEQGLADLRGLGPIERANAIIENCAHPRYKDYLRKYLKESPGGHLHHDLGKCFEMHRNFIESGEMLPE